jgi:hypothetical protein
MKLVMYSIYDSVAEVFNKPFVAPNDATAVRAFEGNKEDANIKDYVLYRVGEWNDASGDCTPCVPQKVFSGLEIKTEAA